MAVRGRNLQCDFRTLGAQAGEALLGALYKRFVSIDPDKIDWDFEANALNDHLRRNWFKPEKARRHIPRVCKESTARRVLWDSDKALYGRYPSDGGRRRVNCRINDRSSMSKDFLVKDGRSADHGGASIRPGT